MFIYLRDFVHLFVTSFGLFMAPTLTASAFVLLTLFLLYRLQSDQGETIFAEVPASLGIIPWVALALTLVATLMSWTRQRDGARRDTTVQFNQEVEQVYSMMASRMQLYSALLGNAREMASNSMLTPAQWQEFVRSSQLDTRAPGVYGLGYVTDVPGDRLTAFLSRVHRSNPGFTVTPAGDRPDYFIVRFLEPASRNAGLLGFDVGSEPILRLVAERARNSGEAVLADRVTLPDDPGHPSFLYFLPVYLAEQAVESIESRQNALRGWVVARFRQDDILKDVVPATGSLIRLQAFDGPEISKGNLFYDSSGFFGGWERLIDNPVVLRNFTVGGQQWTLRFSPRVELGSGASGRSAATVLGGGILLSLWCFGMVWAFVTVRRRGVAMARKMTLELHQREAALTSGAQVIVLVDATQTDMPISYVNSRFEKLTGYTAEEAIGRNCRFLQGNDHDQKGLVELRKALREQREIRVLLRNYRKDGTPFWNDLTVTPLRNEMGRTTQYVANLNDVTERQLTEQRLSSQVAVIRALAESPSLTEAATRILQGLCENLDWDIGVLWGMDQHSNALRCVEIWRQPGIAGEDFERFARETPCLREIGLAGQVWSRSEPVWINDLSQDASFPENALILKEGITAGCGFPVASRNGMQGVLTFYSRKLWPLNKNLLLLMVTTGAQISEFLERQEAEVREKEVNRLERGLAEFMGDGLLAMDREGYCIYANSAAGRWLGYRPRMLLGQPLHDVLHPPVIANGKCNVPDCPVLASLENMQSLHVEEGAVFWRQDRQEIDVAYTTSPIVDKAVIRGVVLTFNPVTRQGGQTTELQKLIEEKNVELSQARQTIEELRQLTNKLSQILK